MRQQLAAPSAHFAECQGNAPIEKATATRWPVLAALRLNLQTQVIATALETR